MFALDSAKFLAYLLRSVSSPRKVLPVYRACIQFRVMPLSAAAAAALAMLNDGVTKAIAILSTLWSSISLLRGSTATITSG